ncbi:hypothetical protein H9L39_07020 [Fusarium oxysporum f. sp. albedinis]|nr:hypothetical protein H9L39_07020 [Fusarium oxysporum f. sp. albedinis]
MAGVSRTVDLDGVQMQDPFSEQGQMPDPRYQHVSARIVGYATESWRTNQSLSRYWCISESNTLLPLGAGKQWTTSNV